MHFKSQQLSLDVYIFQNLNLVFIFGIFRIPRVKYIKHQESNDKRIPFLAIRFRSGMILGYFILV